MLSGNEELQCCFEFVGMTIAVSLQAKSRLGKNIDLKSMKKSAMIIIFAVMVAVATLPLKVAALVAGGAVVASVLFSLLYVGVKGHSELSSEKAAELQNIEREFEWNPYLG